MDRFPGHAVLGEEGQDPPTWDAPIVWVIDPLDGTTNYLNGLSTWCVSIGVLWYGVPVVGAIYAPLGLGDGPALFLSRKGAGTQVNGRLVTVDSATELRPSRLAGLPKPFYDQVAARRTYRGSDRPTRTLGSIALELALTSCGALQYAAFWVPKIWDIAAGLSLVSEAGGTVMRAESRSGPWRPFHSFESPTGEGLRNWRGSILAAHPALAVVLAKRVAAGDDILTPHLPHAPSSAE